MPDRPSVWHLPGLPLVDPLLRGARFECPAPPTSMIVYHQYVRPRPLPAAFAGPSPALLTLPFRPGRGLGLGRRQTAALRPYFQPELDVRRPLLSKQRMRECSVIEDPLFAAALIHCNGDFALIHRTVLPTKSPKQVSAPAPGPGGRVAF
jgi:hypothetical protein